MDGIIDQRIPTWEPPPSHVMLHEGLTSQAPPVSSEVMRQLFDGLDRQMDEHDKEFNLAIDTLAKMYIFSDSDEIKAFLRSHRTLAPVLIEAFPHMVGHSAERTSCSTL